MFWLVAMLPLTAAAALVAWPLLRRRGRSLTNISREETVKALYRDRLQELAHELDGGQLAPEDRAQVEAELGSSLLADYTEYSATERSDSAAAASRPLVAFAVILVIAGSLAIYNGLGDPAAGKLVGASALLTLDPEQDEALLREWQDKLRERVMNKPADARSWYLLGHSELLLGQFQQAAEAFSMAHAEFGADPNVDISWLQARYLAANGQVDSLTRSIAERILQRDPSHALVLEMFASDAFRTGDYPGAVSYLNRALSRAIAPSQRAALQAGMTEARRNLGDLTPSLDVAVAVEGVLPHGTTLFVIARPLGGGMPFAVVRRPAVDFPLSIRLDDAVSMNPAQALSLAKEVEVIVRISLSGSPMAQPGDWEWRSEPIEIALVTQPLQLDALLSAPLAGSPSAHQE